MGVPIVLEYSVKKLAPSFKQELRYFHQLFQSSDNNNRNGKQQSPVHSNSQWHVDAKGKKRHMALEWLHLGCISCS